MLECCCQVFCFFMSHVLYPQTTTVQELKTKNHWVISPSAPWPVLGKQMCKVWHTVISLHRFVTLRFWRCDTLISPQCQLVDTKYMTPSHPRLLFVDTFSETVKTLSRSCKTECVLQRLTGGCWSLEWRCSLFGFMWHHSIMMLICWYSLQNCWI